ncbi:MAG TPA: sialate O-acetylesterase [Planctomycetota bacterium]
MRFASLLLALLVSAAPSAETKLSTLFTDGMVLQRDLACPVWGTAAPGAEVAVEIAGQKKSAKADADGKWSLKLDPLAAGGPHELKIGERVIKDVLVGEVWVCSGQSNMEWSVNASLNPAEEKAAAVHPKLRLFTVPKKQADAPVTDIPSAWKVCGPETVGSFSAVAYFFGRDLQKAIDVPVGLIHTSWGGTAAELWTKNQILAGNSELKPLVDDFPARIKAWEAAVAKHPEAVAKAKAEGKAEPRAPGKPMAPSCLYNGMIAPLLPYGIRGAIWYQGESNASRAKQYETLFPAMIKNWRDDWGQGEFPFGFVQLANFMARKSEPGESNWAELRDAQTKTLALPNTGMAVIIDIGDEKDIHPKNKQDVGKRLSAWAQAQVYKKPVVYSGPILDALKVEGTSARISFKHVGGGLTAKGDVLKGFAIAGEDRAFVWADAKIDGETVVVSSPKVAKPAAVRYAWADNPECNLYNKEGFPASPFRTDAWPRK